MPAPRTEEHEQYWKVNYRLILKLLAVWATVSYVLGILLVEQLNAIQFFGLPLGFWIAQQGSIYLFVLLIFVYARQMSKLDEKFSGKESTDTRSTEVQIK